MQTAGNNQSSGYSDDPA